MKSFRLTVIFLSLIFFSCEKKIIDYGLGEYYEEIVTAKGGNIFETDAGRIFYDKSETDKSYQVGDRVLVNFTLLTETTSGYDFTVRVNSSAKIPLGELQAVSQKNINEAVNETVQLESLWMGNHYLNLNLYFYFKSETHSIGLLADSLSLKSDTVQIYLRHNTKNDPPGALNRLFISFDLEKVLGKPENKLLLLLNIDTSNYGNKTYELKY